MWFSGQIHVLNDLKHECLHTWEPTEFRVVNHVPKLDMNYDHDATNLDLRLGGRRQLQGFL
jgi:hypothetical protein